MGNISSAVGEERRSRTSGYKIKKGFFTNETDNLPQVVAIFAEANSVNQSLISTDKQEITSSEEAGRIFGYGSPIHQIMRILRPQNSQGIGGIPTIVFPQTEAEGATASVKVFSVTGTASKNTTHNLIINGRSNLDFQNYTFNIVKGDTAAIVAAKIADAVNNVLSSPVIASVTTNSVTFTTKWKGLTSSEIKVSFNNRGDNSGLTYASTSSTLGAGTPEIIDGLNQFGDDWNTVVINSYGSETFDILEQFNGTVAVENTVGRYDSMVFKPFMAFSGSLLSGKDSLANLTDNNDRLNQVTNVICPAPNSEGFSWEAAANVAYLFARTMQDSPEIDVNGMSYPDMPIPLDGKIGDMSNYENRDFLVKKGCSTVTLERGTYVIQDLVNTYHIEGENPLMYNYCRNLNLDWNVSDYYRVLEKRHLKDKVVIDDNQNTDSRNAIKPIEWKAVLFEMFDSLAESALINDPSFSKQSIQVGRSTLNPNRFETFFRYKRTGIARIESTTAEAGF